MPDHVETFRRLHQGPEILVLPNAWDAGSARLVESLGARAIATTSAAVAWANGYPDGDALPVDRLVAAVKAIVRVVRVPLSVDAEGGYADDEGKVAENVGALFDAGAVGINLEDGGGTPELLARKIERIKRRAKDLFVNARTDVVLRGLVPEGERVAESLRRGRIYRDAGADCLFVPKVTAKGEIREIAAAAGMPINVLAFPGLPPAKELETLGVRRLSAGSGIASAAWGLTARLAQGFLREGRSEALADGAMTWGEINALFAR